MNCAEQRKATINAAVINLFAHYGYALKENTLRIKSYVDALSHNDVTDKELVEAIATQKCLNKFLPSTAEILEPFRNAKVREIKHIELNAWVEFKTRFFKHLYNRTQPDPDVKQAINILGPYRMNNNESWVFLEKDLKEVWLNHIRGENSLNMSDAELYFLSRNPGVFLKKGETS